MYRIKGFQTEYQTNPMGIAARKPRFSWRNEVSSFVQHAYRILAATRPELLTEGGADLWDSGWVPSRRTVGVEYEGRPLVSRQRCYVKCLVRSEAGGCAESEVSTFETALLSEADWKGKWVSVPVNFQGGTLYFRKVLSLPAGKKPVRARAYVAGIGYHEFFVNGRKIGNSVLNPGVTDYDKRVLYCVYDMLPALEAGDNVVGAEVGYGWFGSRKLLAQFYVEFGDGTVWEDHSGCGRGWWVTGSPVLDNSIYGGETYDARLEENFPGGWCSPAFEPSWENGWMYTILTQPPRGRLEPQNLEPIEVLGEYPARSRTVLEDGSAVFDVGQNLAGWARIRVRGERGARVVLRFGEGLTGDGHVNMLNLRSARCTDTYILKGRGAEEYAPRFTYHGFQYVQANVEGRAEILELTAQHVHSAVRRVGAFACSDETINRLHRMAAVTEENNLHSIMTDCPQRDERFGWLNDLSSRIPQTVYNFDMSRFFPKFVRDITDSQDENGAIADTVPYYTGGQPADPVCVSYLMFGLECYRQYGDDRVAREEYPHFRAWVECLLTHQRDYIMDYSYYGDWVPPAVFEDSKTDGIFISSVFLFWHLKSMARLAEIVGNPLDFERYSRMADESKAAINARYYHRDTKNYSRGTQAENSIALNLRLPPEEDRRAIAANVAADIRRRDYHSTCGNQGYRHMFYALTEEGFADDLFRMIVNPAYPGWGYMAACGATTVWERWEREMQNEMHSFDHPMFGSYDAWFYHDLGGIRIAEDACGADRLEFCPTLPQSLSFADCSLETVRGRAACRWERTAEGAAFEIEVPADAEAEIRLPGKIVSVNGETAATRACGDRECLSVGPGRYTVLTEMR